MSEWAQQRKRDRLEAIARQVANGELTIRQATPEEIAQWRHDREARGLPPLKPSKPEPRACGWCGREFTPRQRHDARWCSPRCGERGRAAREAA